MNYFAFVMWFEPISNPLAHSKLRTIVKSKRGDVRRCGVVELERIKHTCTLSPVLDDTFDEDSLFNHITEDNVMEEVDKFYLNEFHSSVDYQIIAS